MEFIFNTILSFLSETRVGDDVSPSWSILNCDLSVNYQQPVTSYRLDIFRNVDAPGDNIIMSFRNEKNNV